MYDIVIVGSGPAGSNLARLIGDRYKVLLMDKRDPEKPGGSKCCGGLLAPDAQKMIARLGLGIPKDVLVDPQLFAVRTIDITNGLERIYQRFYFNMDRGKFDNWLISLIPPSVDRKYGALFRSFAEVPGGYEVKYIRNGREETAKTRIIVGADGADSIVRKCIRKDTNTPEKYVSIQERFECVSPIPYFTAIFDEEISDFYSWIIPKETYLLFGTALRPGKNAKDKHELLKTKLSGTFHFGNRIKTEGAYINRPKKTSQFCAGKDKIALTGEAAGAISPSSAEGISYALRSSLYLAQSLEQGIDGFLDRYNRKAEDIKLNIFLKNLKSPAMYNPLLRQLIMKSGLGSIGQ
ncbi:MAG: putative oxidoreductase [Firmicutes bacterium ADurb.Bin182]|nr:MAG: putative oxidoreductase [Firmicutes bacterium ADurb.Bin182]